MICQRNQDDEWEMQPPGDPQDLPEGYQVNACENCCRVVPNHSLDNCPIQSLPTTELGLPLLGVQDVLP